MPLIINLILDVGSMLNIYTGMRAPFTVRAIGGYLFLFIGSVLFYKTLGGLKRVDVDTRYLYVSNYLREIKIPLSDVEYVSNPQRAALYQSIKILLRLPSEFGDVLVFTAPMLMGHEIVEELRNRLGGMRARPDDSPLGKAQLLHLKRYVKLLKGKKTK